MSEILFLENVFSWISGFITSIFFDSFSISGFSLISSFLTSETSIVKIKSPSETLSPTFIFKFLILPSKFDGISTLDLSLSIVIRASFFLID